MKKVLVMLAACISIQAFAHENPDRKGQCFIVDGQNITKPCVVSSGGGAGGMYTALKIGKQNILIEESTMNPDSEDRSIAMGKDVDHMLDAEEYYRDGISKKVIKTYKEGSWFCNKQIKGKLDVCFKTR
ncbi:hypothetical protein IEC338SC_3236 [Acinetobacter pittii]|uniref:Uncharacterized protein n=1 Tax=Acinetobacter pittii TaxID=48296 RepID=A0AB33BQ32_ACIPI|nr:MULTISPECIES: hypothetical protein [Acinetobacter calcoaceticus/baumannii complex]AMX20347.1 hypothetical protein IEC338SC_3236 [Acinetobacter pittii]